MKWKNSSENFRDAEVVVPFNYCVGKSVIINQSSIINHLISRAKKAKAA